MQFHFSWTLIWSTVRVEAVEIIIELPWLWGKTPLFIVITPSMLCWVFPCLAGCQTRFPARPHNVLPGVELISPPNKWKWIQKQLRIQNAMNQSLHFSCLSVCTVTAKEEKEPFPANSGAPRHTHVNVAGSTTGFCILSKVMSQQCCVHLQRTNTPTHTHLKTRSLGAECWFANKLSWWQIPSFNCSVKETIMIQCISAYWCGGGSELGWLFLYISFCTIFQAGHPLLSIVHPHDPTWSHTLRVCRSACVSSRTSLDVLKKLPCYYLFSLCSHYSSSSSFTLCRGLSAFVSVYFSPLFPLLLPTSPSAGSVCSICPILFPSFPLSYSHFPFVFAWLTVFVSQRFLSSWSLLSLKCIFGSLT